MRILLFAITILAYLSTAVGQTTNSTNTTTFEPTTAEMGSGDEEPTTIKTTTPNPCAGKCGNYQECPGDCECNEKTLVKSLNGYCAEPCDYSFVWCSNGGECSPNSNGDDFSCRCGPNEYQEEETCTAGKFFGGQITFTTNFEDANDTTIAGILKYMYNCKEAVILNMTEGSTIVDYMLIYERSSNVDETTIRMDFNDETMCDGDGVTSNSSVTGYDIDCDASRSKTTVPGALCNTSSVALPCDEDTARCTEGNGFMSCKCKDENNYKKATPNAYGCLKIPCLSNSGCNSPFGSCNTDEDDELMSYCDCMWGFEGASCQEPWGFVFTILTGAFGVILIIVLTVCICNMRKSKSTKDDKPEDMNLKNPFVDFQPGLVRAKVPNNMYSVSDTYDMTTRDSGGRNNGAYDHAHDDAYGKQTSSFQHEYQSLDNNRRSGASADYF